MPERSKRRWLSGVLIGSGLLIVGGYLLWGPIFLTFFYGGTRADWAFQEVQEEDVRLRRSHARQRLSSASDREAAKRRLAAWQEEASRRCLEIADQNPGTRAEVGCLLFVADRWPDSAEGRSARDRLLRLAPAADIGAWAQALGGIRASDADIGRWRPIIARLTGRVREQAGHPDAARLTCQAGNLVAPDEAAEAAPEEFVAVADLIRSHYAASPDIANFCEQVGGLPSARAPGWGRPFEPHLRAILAANRDRFVRCSASLALASVVRAGGVGRQPEARRLFEGFLAEFDGKAAYHASGIEQVYGDTARQILDTIRTHALGASAPEIAGVDLEGRPLSLSEYRGKVVLVTFWATWCFPCMKAIPHEKALLERFGPERFAIVGVNADEDPAIARDAVASLDVPWRSFRVKKPDGGSIADDWHVAGYPTLYLIDADGVILGTWLGMPAQSELAGMIENRIARPGEKRDPPAADEAAPRETATNGGSAAANVPVEVVADSPGATGFVAKVLRRTDGGESRYVVYIPGDYDAARPSPAILFLHGSGAIGTDGRGHIGALAKAIARWDGPFPFVTVFPQAPSGDWRPGSGHGDLAIAVLDDVLRQYSVDADRVALTGVSMGGEGTWALAAVYPERWSAIVPLCGGGDPKTVARFARVPCWSFQGADDRMIPPSLSREMVRALRQAGGRSIYTEFPGVGHNCWDRAYTRADLFEWLGQRRRGSR
ncbi:redoxin domain-containing protein [Planctomyces sp. SH-PL62]|uniref:redoxin domain-containing protein n=1 Tax=Planctomyces sp. SH-PL62 TaxID=1636152 RepID=UPI00078C2D32|nr:redoxin domain-containing protein [Planctomyces sp. SH-PL62]AMV37887.1 Thiol-disulfide oxidoreductase ResA [Planctomyces sp. SH-PL62]